MVLYKSKFCPHSIRVSTPASHVGHRGSNPLGGTKKAERLFSFTNKGIKSIRFLHTLCAEPLGVTLGDLTSTVMFYDSRLRY